MSTLSKEKLVALSNAELALAIDMDIEKVEVAFANYNKLINYVNEFKLAESDKLTIFLNKSEVEGEKDLGEKTGKEVLAKGKLDDSLAELGAVKGVNLQVIKATALAMLSLELPELSDESEVKNRKTRSGREHYNGHEAIGTLISFGQQLDQTMNGENNPEGQDFTSVIDDFKKLVEDAKEKLDGFKGQSKEIQDALKELNEARKKLEKASEGTPQSGTKNSTTGDVKKTSTASSPKNEKGQIKSGTESLKIIPGNISPDVYRKSFIKPNDNEPLYTVWLDRVLCFEVDGFENDLFWAAEVKCYMTDLEGNPSRIRYSLISKVYGLNEREELRFLPQEPVSGRRSEPLKTDDWDQRGFISKEDAGFALRVNGDARGIALSLLDRVEIDVFLYDTQSATDLTKTIAALGVAGIALLGISKGNFSATPEALKAAEDQLAGGLKLLNKLILKDKVLLEDSLTYRPKDFIGAFAKGQLFDVPQRGTIAACGMPYQRIARAERESGNKLLDTGGIDKYIKERRKNLVVDHKKPISNSDFEKLELDKDKLERFYENKFEDFNEMHFRFEREFFD